MTDIIVDVLIALVTVVQFCLNKFITFRKSAKGKETSDV